VSKYDWDKLKAKYVSGNYKSQKEFAEAEKINYDVLRRHAAKWQDEKSQSNHKKVAKIIDKTVEKIATKEADRNARILSIADKLAGKIECAVEELESYLVTNKVKTKTVTYDNKIAKPTKEVVVENETKEIVAGIVDRQGLRFLTAALKDIRDIQPQLDNSDKHDNGEADSYLDALKSKVPEVWNDGT
jgi:hypothetical protein